MTQQPLTVDLTQVESHRQILSRSPCADCCRIATEEFVIEHHHQPAHEIERCAIAQPGIVLNLGKSYYVEQWLDGKFQKNHFQAGDFVLFPQDISHRTIWDRPIEFLIVGFPPTFIQSVALELSDRQLQPRAELVPHHKLSDSLVHHLGLTLKAELRSSYPSGLYIESMLNALGVHLLRHYSEQPYSAQATIGGLSKLKLKQILEYIDEHLEKPISLAELAAIAQISPHYFASLFKQSVGVPPHQYLVQQRITKVKQLLRSTDLTIAEIASCTGFSSQSHLTQTFCKYLAITPKIYRDQI